MLLFDYRTIEINPRPEDQRNQRIEPITASPVKVDCCTYRKKPPRTIFSRIFM
jgi:hypothetical protein